MESKSATRVGHRVEQNHRVRMSVGRCARSPSAQLLTEVFLLTFRLNGVLLAAGDALVGPIGLTSARWQVLGAIALSHDPIGVPHIALRMGVTRQAVQRHVHHLREEGLVEEHGNPHHARSPLYTLTPAGESLFASVDATQAAWVEQLVQRIPDLPLAELRDGLESVTFTLDLGIEHKEA